MQMLMIVVSLLALFCSSISTDILSPNQSLHDDGQTLVSAGGTFALGFFSPGKSKKRYVGIWYNKLQVRTVVWVANRRNPLSDTNGTLELSGRGILTINSMIFLPMASVNLTNPLAQLKDDGNFVVRESNSSDFAWQSFDYPTDTLLPGMKLGWDLRIGLNRNLTAWRSEDDPSPSSYVFSVDLQGSPQLTLWSGSDKIWRSGPWDGAGLSNTIGLSSPNDLYINFFLNTDEVYYTSDIANLKSPSRWTASHFGDLQLLLWVESSGTWDVFFSEPRSQCDKSSPCGPYGLCDDVNNSPVCSCLQGFTPKSPREWALRDGSLGCVRRTGLDCNNRTDEFINVTHSSLPDTARATFDNTIGSLNECRLKCLKNCSCTAYASADTYESGCIIWASELVGMGTVSYGSGRVVYVRLASADLGEPTNSVLTKSSEKNHGKFVVLITVLSAAAVVIPMVGFCLWRRKRMIQRDIRGDDELDLPQFQWSTVMAATSNFAAENILGKGGFGPVYKGKLEEGKEIAVKRLSRNSTQGVDEFKNEVILIAKLQHRNLVRLLGYCIQGEERMLIYEYMPNGSLDAFLFDKEKGVHLDWQTRWHIIDGIARGLMYLHQDSRFRIIHRDLKASNILLDSEMNPKISDFGLARLSGENESMTITRKVVGTYGYMAPEYALDGIFSVKSDVFSFGVLVLEIISGQRSRVFLSMPHLFLLGNAWNLWNEGKALDLLDPLIGNSFSATQVKRCINISLLCVQKRYEDRPNMSSVVLMLGNDNVPLLEPKAPGFEDIVSAGLDSTPNQVNSYTTNNVTLSVQTGR